MVPSTFAVAVARRHDRVVAAQQDHRGAQGRHAIADARADLRLQVRARIVRRDRVGGQHAGRVAAARRGGPVVGDLLEGVAQRRRGDDQIVQRGLRRDGLDGRRELRFRLRIHHETVHQGAEQAGLLGQNGFRRDRRVVGHRHGHLLAQVQFLFRADVGQRIHAHGHEAIPLHVLVALEGRRFRRPGFRARVAVVRGHERQARLALRTARLRRIGRDPLGQQRPAAAGGNGHVLRARRDQHVRELRRDRRRAGFVHDARTACESDHRVFARRDQFHVVRGKREIHAQFRRPDQTRPAQPETPQPDFFHALLRRVELD